MHIKTKLNEIQLISIHLMMFTLRLMSSQIHFLLSYVSFLIYNINKVIYSDKNKMHYLMPPLHFWISAWIGFLTTITLCIYHCHYCYSGCKNLSPTPTLNCVFSSSKLLKNNFRNFALYFLFPYKPSKFDALFSKITIFTVCNR